ncbi:MAG: LacI family DNA-binding transcriptional regulator [Ktedonobacterales bacterium]
MGQITTSDVARQASVSRITVSRVLNNRGPFTDEVRQRVLQAAHDLGYLPAKSSRHVFDQADLAPIPRTIGDIGFFYSSLLPNSSATNNPYWSPILHGAEREARRSSANVIYRSLSAEAEPAATLRTTIRRMKLGGVLLVGSAEIDLVQLLQQSGVPLVLVDMCFPELSCDCVVVDNVQGIRVAMQYLFALGHQRIAYIGGPVGFTRTPYPRTTGKIFSLERRLASYFLSLLEANLPVDYDLVQTGELSFEGGYQAANALIVSRRKFTAVVCTNDEIAIGAMKAFRECGQRVPEDISVIGFDDIESARHVTPGLTTIGVDKESMGAIAVRALASRARDPGANTTITMLKAYLVERQSVARPK